MAAEPSRESWTRGLRLLAAVLLLLAALLRVVALDKPLYVDEMTTITVASQPLGEMAAVMRLIDASPALYPLLLHGWLHVSHADAWVRLLSAIFGWLAVVAIWRLVTRYFGIRAGLAAAAVMALSPGHVHYSQYVRSYSLFTLLAVVHVWVVLEWTRPGARRGVALWLTAVATTTAMLYTHYLSMLLIGTSGLFVIWRNRSSVQPLIGWIGAVGFAAVLFLPGVPLLQHNMTYDRIRNADRPDRPPLTELVPTLVAEVGTGQRALGFTNPEVRRLVLAGGAVLLPALALVGLRRGWRQSPDATLLLALVAVLPVAIYLGTGRKLVAVRFFLPFMTAYVALIGIGLATLRRWALLAAVTAVVLLSAVPLRHFIATYAWSYDHRAVAAAMKAESKSGDALVVVHPFESFYYRWYQDGTMPTYGLGFTALDPTEHVEYVIKPPPLELERARRRLEAVAERHPRFWVVGQSSKAFASDAGDEAQLFTWIDAHYTRLGDLNRLTDGDPQIRLYGAKSVAPGRPTP